MEREQRAELALWIEGQARSVSEFQERCMAAMEQQATGLLNLLLAGGGGGLAMAVHLSEQKASAWLQSGMSAVTLWLFAVAALLLLRSLWSRPVYGYGNDPRQLKVDLSLDPTDARLFQLDIQQGFIDHDRARNDAVGQWINRCRLLAACVPLVFLIAAAVAAH